MDLDFLVYGYGGFGKLLSSLIMADFPSAYIGVFDEVTHTNLPNRIKHLGMYTSDIYPNVPIIVAVGDNNLRQKICFNITHQFFSYIHPSAFVSDHRLVSSGTIILQNVVVQNGSVIGHNCIIQPNVVIDHDVKIEELTHIYPNSYIGSSSKLSAKSLVLANTSISRNTII